MSETDILEIIEELQCEYKEQENENKYNDYTVYKAKRYSKGLQCLLDIYNKEKEKNKELEKDTKKTIDTILHKYVSKDKIRDKLEKYEEDYERQDKEELYNMTKITAGRISALEELLKE